MYLKHIKKTSLFLVITIWLGLNHLMAQTPYSKEIEEQIKKVENSLAGTVQIEGQETYNLAKRMAFYKIKGLSIAVIHNYKLEWVKGYGWADEAEKRPVTEKTMFMAGSITKSINGMGVLKLAQDKKLDLTADINFYLTTWKFPYDSISKGQKINTLNLLSHTGGVNNSSPTYPFNDSLPTLIQVLNGAQVARVMPVGSFMEPNVRHEYSNNGIAITQVLASDITKLSYEAFITETVLKPLGMNSSFYTQGSLKNYKQVMATGYDKEGNEIPGKYMFTPMLSAGGLWTTPTDLSKFIIEAQLAYKGKSQKVLSQAMIEKMMTPYIDKSAALGVFIEERGGIKYFQHGGSINGFKTQYYGSLEGGNGVIVMVNSDNQAINNEIINSVATVYDWKNFYQPKIKKVVTVPDSIMHKYEGLYTFEGQFSTILKREDGYYYFSSGTYAKMYFTSEADFFNMEFATEKHFVKNASGNITGFLRLYKGSPLPEAVKVLNLDTLHGPEDLFNSFGWHYLENKYYTEASKYLKRGLTLYPKSLVLEGNLAHCYLFAGDYTNAIKIYKAHLNEELSPGASWKDMIKLDFTFFKEKGFDKLRMDKVFADLKLEMPEAYKAN